LKNIRLWLFAILGTAWISSVAWPADSLRWNSAQNQVDADITSANLISVLERISEATGWQVFLEPGTDRTVSTQFKNRSPDKALDLLLGDLNRVLLPPTNGGARLLIFRTTERKATQKIEITEKKPAPSARGRIPNELVVAVKEGTDIEELARQLGARIVGRLDSLNTYRLRFEDAEAAEAAREKLQSREEVLSIADNYLVTTDLPAQGFGGAFPLNLNVKIVPDKDRVIVALIDTILDPEKSGIMDFLLPSISVVGESVHPGEYPLHADAMAQAILRAVAGLQDNAQGTAVRILPVDVYGNNPMTSTFDVAAGTLRSFEFGPRIVNYSLSSYGDAPYLHQVIQTGHQQGIRFFAAPGNEPVTTPTYPAFYDEVIAVTARDPDGSIAGYANRGDFVDVSAPGEGIVEFDGRLWRVAGTSYSTAYVSGTAAAILQKNGGDVTSAENVIRNNLSVDRGSQAK